MKYYIIAGEPSGDLHASNLMKELQIVDSEADFRFWGGDLMKAVGGTLVRHYRETAYMGMFEVLANLRKIQNNFKMCRQDILAFHPDVVILVDYAGFNLRMAKFAKSHGFRVFYYISPKLWAWKTKRVEKVRKYVDQMFSIMPFETSFYQKYGVSVNYIGNPIMDSINGKIDKNDTVEAFRQRNNLDSRPIVGILAGSRKQELVHNMGDMLKMVSRFPDYQFIIAGAPSFTPETYKPYIEGYDVKVLFDETYPVLRFARAAMVTSGTATLEAGIINCPQVVCYQMSGGWFTDIVAKKIFIKVPYISLVNLILEKESVKELFQRSFSLEKLEKELRDLLEGEARRKTVFSDYDELRKRTGGPGSSKRAASLMIQYLNEAEQ